MGAVTARPQRPVGYDQPWILDATEGVAPVPGGVKSNPDGTTTLTFPETVTEAQLEAVRERMVTRDDAELEQRQIVTEGRAAVAALLGQVAAFDQIEAPDLEDHFNQIHVLSDFALAAASAFAALANLVLGRADHHELDGGA